MSYKEIPASASTDGQGVVIAGTNLAAATLIHTATAVATEHDLITLFFHTISTTADQTVTVVLSDQDGRKVVQKITKEAGMQLVLPRVLIKDGVTVKAYCPNANQVVATAYVERVTTT